MYEQPIDLFLIKLYTSIGSNIEKILESKSKKINTQELKEMYEIKGKVIDSLDCMCRLTENDDLKSFYSLMANLVSSDDVKNLNLSLYMCNSLIKS
jgi:hypothetical protein